LERPIRASREQVFVSSFDQNQTLDVTRMHRRVKPNEKTTEGMADEDKRRSFAGVAEELVKLRDQSLGRPRCWSRIAPAVAGAIVRTHTMRSSEFGLHPAPVDGPPCE
jgi:hypothetical protein